MGTGARRLVPLLLLTFAFTTIGCSNRPRLAEVKGTVKYRGKPLANIMVEFVPEAKEGVRSSGTTDASGQFTLVCDDKRPGAMVGPNRVVLRDLNVLGEKFLGRKAEAVGMPGGPQAKPSRIPEALTDLSRTTMKREVKNEPQTFDLEITAP